MGAELAFCFGRHVTLLRPCQQTSLPIFDFLTLHTKLASKKIFLPKHQGIISLFQFNCICICFRVLR